MYFTLLCDVEAWTLDKKMEKKTESLEMLVYRRIGWILWTEKKKRSTKPAENEKRNNRKHTIQTFKIFQSF